MYRFRYDGTDHPKLWPTGVNDRCVLAYLSHVQSYFNEVLIVNGYVFLSQVLMKLDLKSTSYALVTGWTLDGDGDGFIDFGITSAGYPMGFDLNFNCDGYILDKIN